MQVATPFAHHVPTDLTENLRWKARVHRRVLEDPEYAQIIWDACAQDPIFYVNGFVYTHDPRRDVFRDRPMILYPYQVEGLLEIIRAINDHDLYIEKSRDMGASWLCILAFEWAWHFHPSMSFLMGSRTEDYVDKSDNPKALFWKIDFLHRHLPHWLMPPGYDENCRTRLHMRNPSNRSVIDGESTTKNFARGDRRSGVMCDEFAAVDQGDGIIASVADVTECAIYNSTPQGVGNAYERLRHTAIKKLRFFWTEHPEKSRGLYTTDENDNLKVLDPDGYPKDYRPILDGKLRSPAYDRQEARLGKRKMAQEWDIDYEGSGHQFFVPANIQENIRKFARPALLIGELEYDPQTAEPIRFHEDSNGHLQLWCLLDKDGKFTSDHRIVIGADVSAGSGASNSTLCAYDESTNEKLAEYANPYIRPEDLARQGVALARWMNKALIIWESNGPGGNFGARIIDLGYGNIYYRRREGAISREVTKVPGWPQNKEAKRFLFEEYRSALEKFLCVNRSKLALEETLEYIYDNSGGVVHARANDKSDPSGAKANHGDRAGGDVLAWRGMTERKVSVPKPEKREPPYGSLAWRIKMREEMKPKRGRELLHAEGWG